MRKSLLILVFVILFLAPFVNNQISATNAIGSDPSGLTASASEGFTRRRSYHRNRSSRRYRGPVRAASAPIGASARCVDGSYSFSEHRRGTCSHHGGVAEWL